MPVAQPARRGAGVVERLACRQQVQVAVVGIQTAPELRGTRDMTVAGNGRGRRVPPLVQPVPVIAERVGGEQVRERDLDIGEHVTRQEKRRRGISTAACPGA